MPASPAPAPRRAEPGRRDHPPGGKRSNRTRCRSGSIRVPLRLPCAA